MASGKGGSRVLGATVARGVFFVALDAGCSGPPQCPDGTCEPPPRDVTTDEVPSSVALSDATKRRMMLSVMEAFVTRAELTWVPNDMTGVEHAGFFYMPSGNGMYWSRSAAAIAFVYATLLSAEPTKELWSNAACRNDAQEDVPCTRDHLKDHLFQTIRHQVHSNVRYDANDYYPDDRLWPRTGGSKPGWQRSMETYGWAWAAELHLDDLIAWDSAHGFSGSTRTTTKVTEVVNDEANVVLDAAITPTTSGDTGAEENSWNTGVLVAAAAMFPTDPDASAWQLKAKEFAVNSVTKPGDDVSPQLIDGQPLGTYWWVTDAWLADRTLVNHGFFHTDYLTGTFATLADSMIFHQHAGYPIPEAFEFRVAEIWDHVGSRLFLDDADTLHPYGSDWTRHDYQNIEYLALLATRFQRHDASVYESRALELLTNRQLHWSNGGLYGFDNPGYETENVRTLAAAWWLHELFGASPSTTQAQFDAARHASGDLRDTMTYPDAKLVLSRKRDALVSMAWNASSSSSPALAIVPSFDRHDPIVTATIQNGGVGPTATSTDYFTTTGSTSVVTATTGAFGSGARQFALAAFEDGTTLLLERGTGATYNFGFERIAGVVGRRPIYHQGPTWNGDGTLDLTGNWANVADRFGLVVLGGGGMRVSNEAPNDERNDGFVLEGSKATGTGYRVAAVFPKATSEETSALSSMVQKHLVPSSDLGAVTVRGTNGLDRLAVANWGTASTELLVSTAVAGRGDGLVEGAFMDSTGTGSGVVSVAVEGRATTAHTLRFYLQTPPSSSFSAQALSSARAWVENDSGTQPLTALYVSSDGVEQFVTRTLPNGTALVTHVDGGIAIARTMASSSVAGFPSERAFDDSAGAAGTSWQSAEVTGADWVGVDFDKTVAVGRVTVIPVNASDPNPPKDYVIETSNDGVTWTSVAGESSVPGGSACTTIVPGVVNAKMVRVRVTALWGSGATSVRIDEIVIEPPARATASSAETGYQPVKAYDNDEATFWVSGRTFVPWSHPEHVTLDFSSRRHVRSVTMLPHDGYGPKTYGIEVSDDGMTFTQVAFETGLSSTGSKTTTLAQPADTRYVRLKVYDSHDSQTPPRTTQIEEISVN